MIYCGKLNELLKESWNLLAKFIRNSKHILNEFDFFLHNIFYLLKIHPFHPLCNFLLLLIRKFILKNYTYTEASLALKLS